MLSLLVLAPLLLGACTSRSDWPADAPVYEPAEMEILAPASVGDKTGLGMSLTTDDTVEQVIAYYKSEWPKQGWTITNERDIRDGKAMSATKGSRKSSVMTYKDKGHTFLQLGVQLE